MAVISLRNNLEELAGRLIPYAQAVLVGPLEPRAEDVRTLLAVSLPYALRLAEKAADDLATVDAESGRTREYVLQKKAGIYTAAKKAIEAEIAGAKADSAKLKAKLEKLALPPLPDGISEPMLLERKRDLEALLEAAGTPEGVSIKADELARTATLEGDALTAHVLGAGLLRFFLELHANKPEELAVALSEITASGPAGKVLALWKGPDGIAAAVVIADTALYGELQTLQERSQAYAPPPWKER